MVIPEPHEEVLTDKKLTNYKEHRKKFLVWLLNVGKDPERAEGFSPHTVYGTSNRTAEFDKWRWENCGGTRCPTEAETQELIEWLASQYDQSETAERLTAGGHSAIQYVAPIPEERRRVGVRLQF
jgi:hypothetical protein